MKLPRTNIGLAGSPPSKGGISGAGGYVLKRPSFREYYTGKKRPIKEDEEEEEKKEMSPLAKTAAALGISIAAIMALSPTAEKCDGCRQRRSGVTASAVHDVFM